MRGSRYSLLEEQHIQVSGQPASAPLRRRASNARDELHLDGRERVLLRDDNVDLVVAAFVRCVGLACVGSGFQREERGIASRRWGRQQGSSLTTYGTREGAE